MRGKVKWFSEEKGYGFITCEDGKDAFVHIKDLDDDVELVEGQTVEFDRTVTPKGLKAAVIKIVAMLLVLLLSGVLLGGCAADRATVDHRAAVMTGVADRINADGVPTAPQDQLDFALCIENERRAAVNLSDALHWRKPTYKYPAKRPTTLPWRPEDDVSAAGGQ